MRRSTVSLDSQLFKDASKRADEVAGGNLSLLTAVALRRILDVPVPELKELVALQRYDRTAPTRNEWMRGYWYCLQHIMGRPEMDFMDNPYTPRQFGDFYAVLLLNHVGRFDDENDPFYSHIGPMPVLPGSPPPCQWRFERPHSPLAAAQTVATKLREYGVVVGTSKGR